MNELPNNLTLSFNLDGVENETSGVRKRERIKDGISCYRILPPYGPEHSGLIFRKYTVHWGFVGANGKERSVACSYPTEGYCPVCARLREADEELKRAQTLGNSTLVDELQNYIQKFRAKKFWLYNAVTADGRVVMLEMGKTAHDGLNKKISEAVRRKVGAFDPISVDTGVWFEFNRSGKGLNTEYSVDFKKTSVTLDDGSVADKPDRNPLPADLVEQIKASLMGKAPSIMHDIHHAHDATTSSELKALMNGGTAPMKASSASVQTAQTQAQAQTKPPAAANQSSVQAEIDRLRQFQTGQKLA